MAYRLQINEWKMPLQKKTRKSARLVFRKVGEIFYIINHAAQLVNEILANMFFLLLDTARACCNIVFLASDSYRSRNINTRQHHFSVNSRHHYDVKSINAIFITLLCSRAPPFTTFYRTRRANNYNIIFNGSSHSRCQLEMLILQ